jgi:ketosteroid isomerase-like protein
MDRAEALDLLRRLHDAQGAFYAGAEEAPVRALLTEDVHWHVPGRNAIAGDYHGIDAVLAYFRRRRDLVDRTFRMHLGDVLVGDGTCVAALTDGTAMAGGVERRWSTVGLYQLHDGRVGACWLLPLDPATFDDIWTVRGEDPTCPRPASPAPATPPTTPPRRR